MRLPVLLLVFVVGATCRRFNYYHHQNVNAPFRDCGGNLTASVGTFHTPNFPNAFPVPISCQWVLSAPQGYGIVVYMTQLFLKEGLKASEYTAYSPPWSMGHRVVDLNLSPKKQTKRFRTHSSFLVVDLQIKDLAQANIRVLDHFLDVFGFNATYEFVRENDTVRDLCSISSCAFSGHCLADPGPLNIVNFSCHCFPKFKGDYCEHGPKCDPANGINACLNGGICKHLVGSRIYTCFCPKNFSGRNCEIPKEDLDKIECSYRCSQLCTSNASCACKPGFRLQKDNKTCLSEMSRYEVSVMLTNHSSFSQKKASNHSVQYFRLKSMAETQLLGLLRDVRQIRNLSVLELSSTRITFHFFANGSDTVKNFAFLEKLKRNGYIGNLSLDKPTFTYFHEPALSIQWAEIPGYQNHPVQVGQEVHIACVVHGSSSLKVAWYKDEAPIDFSRIEGKMFETVLAKNSLNQSMGLLSIEKVHEAHGGKYTCVVSDWGEEQNRSVILRVQRPATVVMENASISVEAGSELNILCSVKGDAEKGFGYSWSKNDNWLETRGGDHKEIYEDIFPTGSLLKVPRVDVSATYTCHVAGVAKDCRVTVIDPAVGVCPAEEYFKIQWRRTAPNAEDIHDCPPTFTGQVVRRCSKVAGDPYWEEPDFSKCISPIFASIVKKFDNLRFGFLVSNTSQLMESSMNYLQSRRLLYPGEGNEVLDLMSDITVFEDKYIGSQQLGATDVFYDVISHLLSNSQALNSLKSVLKLLHLVQRRATMAAQFLPVGTSLRIDRDSVAIDIRSSEFDTKGKFILDEPTRISKAVDSNWRTHTIELNLEPSTILQESKYNATVETVTICFRNLSNLLPKRFVQKLDDYKEFQFELHSKVVAVIYLVNSSTRLGLLSENGGIKVAFDKQEKTISRNGWNLTCGMANATSGKLEWSVDSCKLMDTEYSTECMCTRFGTYVALLSTFHTTGGAELYGTPDPILATGCLVGCSFIFLALISMAICWKQMLIGFAMLKMQICLALLGAMTTFLGAVQVALPLAMYPYVAAILEFLLLQPLAMHICLELLLYLELSNVGHVKHAIVKVTLLGWGIPMIVTAATLIAQNEKGFSFQRWWIKIQDTFFFGFTISSVILVLLYVLLYLVVTLELRHVISAGSPHRNCALRSIGLLRRSLIIQAAVVATSVCSVLYVNNPSELYRYSFAASCALTGFFVFVLYSMKGEGSGCVCSKGPKRSGSRSSAASIRSNATTHMKLEGTHEMLTVNNRIVDVDRRRRCRPSTGSTSAGGTIASSASSDSRLDPREMEDLLRDAAISTRNNRNSVISAGKRMWPNNEDADEDGFKDGFGGRCRAVGAFRSSPLHPIGDSLGLVDYEGSPKKYPSSKEGTEVGSSVSPDDCPSPSPIPGPCPPVAYCGPLLRPEPGMCYIRDSPESRKIFPPTPPPGPSPRRTPLCLHGGSSGSDHGQSGGSCSSGGGGSGGMLPSCRKVAFSGPAPVTRRAFAEVERDSLGPLAPNDRGKREMGRVTTDHDTVV